LPVISYEVTEGGQKSHWLQTWLFSLGVTNECNSVTKRYSALWNTQPSELMLEYRLPITYVQGKSEIQPEFVLFEPSTIRIKIINRYHSSNHPIAAAVEYFTDNPMEPTKHTLLSSKTLG
jgi:hypothetical protein